MTGVMNWRHPIQIMTMIQTRKMRRMLIEREGCRSRYQAEEPKTQIKRGKLVDEAVRSYVVLELISEH